MHKPRYTEELLKIIFLWLGVMFVGMGFLSFIGVLKPTASSVIQAPTLLGLTFSMFGLFFVIVHIILGVIAAKKNKLCAELLASGTKIHGVVEKIYLQKYTQYGNQSPYRILYTYTHQGEVYHHKSCFLWEKPNLMAGDSITVYANDFGKSTVLF